MEEAEARQYVIPFSAVLSSPEVLTEARRRAQGASMRLEEFGEVVNPYLYMARSPIKRGKTMRTLRLIVFPLILCVLYAPTLRGQSS